MTYINKSAITLSAAALVIVPLSFLSLWFYTCAKTSNYPDVVQLYHSYLPGFLDGRYTATLVSLPLCIGAFVLSLINLHDQKAWIRWLSRTVLILAGLLGLINLWSIM